MTATIVLVLLEISTRCMGLVLVHIISVEVCDIVCADVGHGYGWNVGRFLGLCFGGLFFYLFVVFVLWCWEWKLGKLGK